MMKKQKALGNFWRKFSTKIQCQPSLSVNIPSVKPNPIQIKPNSTASIGATPLTDKFGRFHSYLRISLTEKCNLRCQYCMPADGVPLTPASHLLTREEIIRITEVFSSLGVDKVRLTGGEPTMRKDLLSIIEGIANIPGIKQVGMTSNGVALTAKLDGLVKVGLSKLNLSLDTLHEQKYEFLTRRRGYKQVWKAIDKAEEMFDMLKLNCVVMRQFNLEEVIDFVKLTENRKLDIRFIEFMPFGGNDYTMNKFVPYKEMMTLIIREFADVERLKDHPNDTSKAFKIRGFKGQFGFITSMSEHFCATCNRLRVTADGNLKVCLHGNAEVSLRDAIRSGSSTEELENIIGQAVYRKKAAHAGQKNLMNTSNRPMILIGLNTLHSSLFNLFPKYSNNFIRLFSTSLTHVDQEGKASMVDVSHKSPTTRIALAQSKIKVSPSIMQALKDNSLKKGDALSTARIAGIQAAKKTSDFIPLCHQIPLTNVQVKFFLDEENLSIIIFSRVKTIWSTGVEMEALMAASSAALVIYDMSKALGHNMEIFETKLLGKLGGKRDMGFVDFEKLSINLKLLK